MQLSRTTEVNDLTTARPNQVCLQEAVSIYRDAMRPFLIRELKKQRGVKPEEAIRQSLPPAKQDYFIGTLRGGGGRGGGGDLESAIDVNDYPLIVQRNKDAFHWYLDRDKSFTNKLWLIIDGRNKVAHPSPADLDGEYVRTQLFLIADVLNVIGVTAQKTEIDKIRDRLLGPDIPYARLPLPEPEPANGKPAQQRGATTNLKPWREVIQPRHDVVQGTYSQAEFAADLQQVHDGRAANEYGNPVSFFAQTYMTPGLRALLLNALKRIGGTGGDPVIQTKTGFGGGKTHSLIALYHLAKHASALVNPAGDHRDGERVREEIRGIAAEAGLDPDAFPSVSVAVLDGIFLSPNDTAVTSEKGDPLNTLWGVMAYQLGGQEGYDVIGNAARSGTAPGGDLLSALFRTVGPCVILMDELVAYARNADSDMQPRIFTFVQALTQSARAARNVVLVVTLLESEQQAGGQSGMDTLASLEDILGRIETVWEPLRIDEAFEVVRRRLFDSDVNETERDRTCQAFATMYQRARSEYPQQMGEGRYLERLKACYPVHPEIFDRLYEDWSAIPDFQRTRGVLRMMATAVSRLYRQSDASPLIMPAQLPLDDPALGNEFTRLLSGNWRPVLSEVDSDGSKADEIDGGSRRFANVGGAARRLARTIFLGSAPTGAVKGIDIKHVHVGIMQPGHGVADYNDALRRMTDELYFLYSADGRYYFHVDENLNKVVSDRMRDLDTRRDVDAHISGALLVDARGRRGDVIVCPEHSGDVPDTDSVRLVILPPDKSLPSRSQEMDDAETWTLEILRNRGDAGRVRRNTLLFLTAKKDDIRNLRDAARKYLAWYSMLNGDRRLALQGDRASTAQASLRNAESEMRNTLTDAYRWALAPGQDDPQKAEYRMHSIQVPRSDGDLVEAAFRKCVEEEQLIAQISPTVLNTLLQQYVWSNEAYSEHITLKSLWDMLTNNVYLPRLRFKAVLQQCISEGVEQRAFGYAFTYRDGQYQSVSYGRLHQVLGALGEDNDAVLIHPAKASELASEATPTDPGTGDGVNAPAGSDVPSSITPWPPDIGPQPRTGPARISARKRTSGDISLDDISQLRDEIITNLQRDGGEVTVEITITGRKPGGFSESTLRAVRENSVQLSLEFDEGSDA